MEIDVFTLFPEAFGWFQSQRHVTNAIAHGSRIELRQLPRPHPAQRRPGRRHAVWRRGRHGAARRRRRGGAAGLATARTRCSWPRGGGWSRSTPADGCSTRRWSAELAAEPALTLLCGRYEGFDERILEHFVSDRVSIGRYVLAGGELAAMVLCDAVLRKLPGSLGHQDSAIEESFSAALGGRSRVPALHPPGRVPRLGGARGPALRPPRPDRRVAPAASSAERERRAASRVGRDLRLLAVRYHNRPHGRARAIA